MGFDRAGWCGGIGLWGGETRQREGDMNKRRAGQREGGARSWWRPWTWWRRAEPVGFARSAQQLEMMLGAVKPVRNPLVEDDVELVARRREGRVLHETRMPVSGPTAVEVESDRAWERLRGRRVEQMKVHAD